MSQARRDQNLAIIDKNKCSITILESDLTCRCEHRFWQSLDTPTAPPPTDHWHPQRCSTSGLRCGSGHRTRYSCPDPPWSHPHHVNYSSPRLSLVKKVVTLAIWVPRGIVTCLRAGVGGALLNHDHCRAPRARGGAPVWVWGGGAWSGPAAHWAADTGPTRAWPAAHWTAHWSLAGVARVTRTWVGLRHVSWHKDQRNERYSSKI